jgi:hypothetical protein
LHGVNMDAKLLIELVQQAEAEQSDYYRLASLIAEAQKEVDAKLAEAMGATSVANAIRVAA